MLRYTDFHLSTYLFSYLCIYLFVYLLVCLCMYLPIDLFYGKQTWVILCEIHGFQGRADGMLLSSKVCWDHSRDGSRHCKSCWVPARCCDMARGDVRDLLGTMDFDQNASC